MKKVIYILFLLSVAVTAMGQESQPLLDTVNSAPGITIETSVDRAEIYIGDLINYTITIIYDSTIEVTPPPVGASLGAFDIKDYDIDNVTRLDDGRMKLESKFRLTTFTTGDYLIPVIPVEYMMPDSTKKILVAEPLAIRVKSILAESADTTDIRAIKGPIAFDKGLPFYYWIIGAWALLVAVLLFIVWWKRKHAGAESEPVDTRPAWEIAFEKLAVLKEKNLPASGEFKLYYIELTEIIRDFMQRIYSIPALDMTTYEFLEEIKEKDIRENMFGKLKTLLEFGDLVKFAKLEPQPDRMEDDYIEVWSMIDETRQIEMNRPVEVEPVTEDMEAEENV